MEIDVVGRIQDPDQRKFEAITVPVAGYTLAGDEIIERFDFRPVMNAGAVLKAYRAVDANSVLASGPVVEFLEKSLMPGESERFLAFLGRDDLMIEASVISDVYRAVTEVWAARPTPRGTGSSPGGSPGRRTSRAGQRSRASIA